MCRLSWNLGASTSWNPQGLSRPVMGLLYLCMYRASSLFYTVTNKCTIISQIITLLHVSILLCHSQGAFNQYLTKLHEYFKCSCWKHNLQLRCVETCRSVIICEIIVHLLVIVQNKNKNKCVCISLLRHVSTLKGHLQGKIHLFIRHRKLVFKCVLANCHSKGVTTRRVRWPSTEILTDVYSRITQKFLSRISNAFCGSPHNGW